MLTGLVQTAFIFGVFVMIFWTPAIFTKGIFIISYGELSSREKIMMWIPVVNIIRAEKAYTGRVSTVGIGVISFIVTLALRLMVVFLIPSSTILNIITIMLWLLSVLAYMLTNIVLIWMVLTDTDVTSMGTKVAMSIVFPLGQYYVGNLLPRVMKNLAKEGETFK